MQPDLHHGLLVSMVGDLLAKSAGMAREEIDASFERFTLRRRFQALAEVANVAAFMASDRASAMTGSIANLTCGSIVD